MSISAVRYPSVSAKLNGMYAKKLKKAELDELLKQNTSKQAITLLKTLKEDFKNLEDNSRRIKLKILLDDSLIKDIKKISRLLNNRDKKVFEECISIYEIKCIKSVFRKLSSNSILNEQTNEVENWVHKLFTHLQGIENVTNYEEFQMFLRETPYAFVFKQYGSDISQIDIFEIENQLDKFYFEKLMKLTQKTNAHWEDMVGKQIDLNNIIWMYRVKEFYHFTNEQTKNILIDVYYRLKKSEVEKLVEANTEKEITEILKTTYYAKYIDFSQRELREANIDRYLYTVYQKYFRGNIFDSSMVYAYLNIIEDENNDIMNIIEGIRYQLNRDEIRKKLVR